MLVIVDYGAGNIQSIKNMLKKIGVQATISSSAVDVAAADKLILPGVGHFDYGMQKLNHSGLVSALNEKVLERKTPILGICLGVQLFTKRSDEGSLPGLGWFDAETVKFRLDAQSQLKIPHMGWNEVHERRPARLLEGLENPRFYFVHSYHLKCNDPADELLASAYGYEFACGLERENITGVQFHPEKSHKYGMQLLKNFIEKY